jgi:hypothetical protein
VSGGDGHGAAAHCRSHSLDRVVPHVPNGEDPLAHQPLQRGKGQSVVRSTGSSGQHVDPSPERGPWQRDGGGAVPDAGEDEGGPADLQRREGLPGQSGGDDDAADELKVAEQRHLAGRQVAQPVAPEGIGRGRTRDPELDERAQRNRRERGNPGDDQLSEGERGEDEETVTHRANHDP